MSETLNTLMYKIQSAYRMDESLCLDTLLPAAMLPASALLRVEARAQSWVVDIRQNRWDKTGLDAFLNEYDLSSDEGIALMCLAEALLRIPDAATRDSLIKDKILMQDWEKHLGKSHSWFVNASTFGLMLTGKLLRKDEINSFNLLNTIKRLASRLSEPVIRQAVTQGMKILGKQFVMGETIEAALKRAKPIEARGYRYSYDMLGEAAKTREDAEYYLKSYQAAIEKIGAANHDLNPIQGPGISVKLSALHPRYEWANRHRVTKELLPTLKKLVLQAKEANIGFTIDAEEADRLTLSLLLLEELAVDKIFDHWQGLGLAVQAYQKRAWYVVDWLTMLSLKTDRQFMVRLVKGAYWDSEIKWSQERGLSYPVFTRKSSTDVSYLAVAKKIISLGNRFLPQFATHNAYTVACILEMVEMQKHKESFEFEFQCLHGMGEALFDKMVGPQNLNIPCRIYAPVGEHDQLLPYLVRRLLENGANSSFVNRIIDEKIPIEDLIQNPSLKTQSLVQRAHPKIPDPKNLYGNLRPNARGLDLNNPQEIDPVLEDIEKSFIQIFAQPLPETPSSELDNILQAAHQASQEWNQVNVDTRVQYLQKAAELLEENRTYLMALLIREGGKTVQDALSEVREAIDFCWYYRERLRLDFEPIRLPGPTGEQNELILWGRGVFACISPWNFPLAIFLGQILGALSAGNVVIAKPASQTLYIAKFAIDLLHQAGFSKQVLHLVIGSGATVGARLIQDPKIAGIMFTGSTDTARGINLALANRPGPIIPLIAETGGQNVMLVDSSALPEQVVTDVLTSAFNSAGQRCSALRVLFIQDEVADKIITMLKGAMQELKLGDPFDLSTDVGPVIDQNACYNLEQHAEAMQQQAKLIYQCELKNLPTLPRGVFFAPRAYEIESIEQLTQENFGPILHVVRFKLQDLDKILDSINQIGYGLTLGIHSRINETVAYIQSHLRVGNIYVNRNMIGAVVGVQPFGGEGLSGTGPKAGGPHILPRLAIERTVSVNTAAAGGNLALMSLE